MEIILAFLFGIIIAFGYLLDKATDFIKQLKSNGSVKLNRGFVFNASVVPIDKKSEVSAPNTNSTFKNDLD